MRLTSFRARYLLLLAAASGSVVLPVASAGCGRTACIVYSKAEYDVHASCPLQKDALPYLTDGTCPGPVVSVDGEGVFTLNEKNPNQSLCCYPVTQQTIELDDQRIDCIPPGTGGTGGFEPSGSSGVGGVGGVGGGFGGCFACNQLVTGVISDPGQLCPGLFDMWVQLDDCVCAQETECFSACKLSFCQNAPVSTDCLDCMAQPDASCAAAFATCNFN